MLAVELQRELGMAAIFVTHDIGVVVEVADRTAVMHAGPFVEPSPARTVIKGSGHPYTKGLLSSTAHGAMRGKRLEAIPSAPPNLAEAPASRAIASDRAVRCVLSRA